MQMTKFQLHLHPPANVRRVCCARSRCLDRYGFPRSLISNAAKQCSQAGLYKPTYTDNAFTPTIDLPFTIVQRLFLRLVDEAYAASKIAIWLPLRTLRNLHPTIRRTPLLQILGPPRASSLLLGEIVEAVLQPQVQLRSGGTDRQQSP